MSEEKRVVTNIDGTKSVLEIKHEKPAVHQSSADLFTGSSARASASNAAVKTPVAPVAPKAPATEKPKAPVNVASAPASNPTPTKDVTETKAEPKEEAKKPTEDEKIEKLPKPNVDPNSVVTVESKHKVPEMPVPQKEPMDPKLKRSIFIAGVGLFTLAVGGFFLIKTIIKPPKTLDGSFLVSVGKWTLDGEPSVVWNFTEVGKGKLTTNRHLNDYDFIWAIDGNKLSIETDWLYTLNDTYEYELDQNKQVLTLMSGGANTYTFVPSDEATIPEVEADAAAEPEPAASE